MMSSRNQITPAESAGHEVSRSTSVCSSWTLFTKVFSCL